MPEELLTIQAVAKQFNVDETTVRRWILTGSLEGIALPNGGTKKTIRVKRSTVEKALSNIITPHAAYS